jgi:outer membrane protein assembly factor BamB
MMCAATRGHASTLEPLEGHPDSAAILIGTAFADSEPVDVDLGTKQTLVVTSKRAGGIKGSLTIRVTAQAGKYTFAAITRRSPAAAKASCMVYVSSDHAKVYAITSGGRLDWAYATGAAVNGSPAVANGMVYVGAADHTFYAIKRTDGTLAWAATTGGAVVRSVAVAFGLVFAGSEDGTLYAFNAHTGAVQWRVNFGGPSVDRSPPVAASNVVAMTDEASRYTLDSRDSTLGSTPASWDQSIGNRTIISRGVLGASTQH